MTAGQLLELVPRFRERLLKEIAADGKRKPNLVEPEKTEPERSDEALVAKVAPTAVYDEHVPVVAAEIGNLHIANVLIDGGSGVNVLSESLCAQLGITTLSDAPFAVKMADQRRVQPLGLVRHLDIRIAQLPFAVAAVVLRMEDIHGVYPLLLGRPWLKQAKAKQNSETNELSLRKGKHKIKMQELQGWAQSKLAAPASESSITDLPPPTDADLPCEPPEWNEVLAEEKAFYREREFSQRVKEDALTEVNLGTVVDPRPVKISADLDEAFYLRFRHRHRHRHRHRFRLRFSLPPVLLVIAIAMVKKAPRIKVNFLPLHTFELTKADKLWLRTLRLEAFTAIPIQEQPVREDLPSILCHADEEKHILLADDKEHDISIALVADRLQLPTEGINSFKEADRVFDEFMNDRFTTKQAGEYYTHHWKTQELRRRYEWFMEYVFMHPKGDRMSKANMALLAAAEAETEVAWASLVHGKIWEVVSKVKAQDKDIDSQAGQIITVLLLDDEAAMPQVGSSAPRAKGKRKAADAPKALPAPPTPTSKGKQKVQEVPEPLLVTLPPPAPAHLSSPTSQSAATEAAKRIKFTSKKDSESLLQTLMQTAKPVARPSNFGTISPAAEPSAPSAPPPTDISPSPPAPAEKSTPSTSQIDPVTWTTARRGVIALQEIMDALAGVNIQQVLADTAVLQGQVNSLEGELAALKQRFEEQAQSHQAERQSWEEHSCRLQEEAASNGQMLQEATALAQQLKEHQQAMKTPMLSLWPISNSVEVDAQVLADWQSAHAEDMEAAMQNYVRMLTNIFQLQPTCKVMKQLGWPPADDDDDDADAGSQPQEQSAAAAAASAAATAIDVDAAPSPEPAPSAAAPAEGTPADLDAPCFITPAAGHTALWLSDEQARKLPGYIDWQVEGKVLQRHQTLIEDNQQLIQQTQKLQSQIDRLKAEKQKAARAKRFEGQFQEIEQGMVEALKLKKELTARAHQEATERAARHTANITADLRQVSNNLTRYRGLFQTAAQYLKEVCQEILVHNVIMPEPHSWNRIEVFLQTNTMPPHLQFHPLQPQPVHVPVVVRPVPPPPAAQPADDGGEVEDVKDVEDR
ncbi:hypothetical protein L7F22_035381 [Adiantum nelumboides]|nr:hypothetical protein [Adiantum nelumboides]